ncbi:MAG TPA: hypothetical protein VN106_06905 [Sphingomicrobium sp.]|nr:hypothetical protein [Sphingomicrobium sp.]
MTSLRDKNYSTLGTILAAAVADTGTFTVAYPTGTTQLDFNVGLAKLSGCYVVLNGNDKISYGSSGVYIDISFGASNITITNHSGYSWPIGTKVDAFFDVQDGNVRIPMHFHLKLAKIANGDLVTEIRPGIDGTIEYWEAVVSDPATTAAKLATLNLEIDTTNVTGGTLALTSANMTPLGAVVGNNPTGANTLTRASKLSIEASSVTTFVEGEIELTLYIRPTSQDQY